MPVSTRRSKYFGPRPSTSTYFCTSQDANQVQGEASKRRRLNKNHEQQQKKADQENCVVDHSASPYPHPNSTVVEGDDAAVVEQISGIVTPDSFVSTPSTTVSTNNDDDDDSSDKKRTPAAKRRKKRKKASSSPDTPIHHLPPEGWEEIYGLVEELREDRTAPVDSVGCEALPDPDATPEDYRFQVLISLMLSSQTKDATVGAAIRGMQKANVLSVDKISDMSVDELDEYIAKVGFHNNKSKYIKQSVEILREKYNSDIPPTASEMMELPGVGPKMAYICESVAWKRQTGLGIDTHMHRLFNLLKWVDAKNPEKTRLQLEAWLPREKWPEVNLLWVGFGQEIQQFKPKILRKALDCSRPAEALGLLKRCGMDYVKEGKRIGLEDEIESVLGCDE